MENSITQIRHDGLSFVLASQFPERIPERIFKYLLTRLIFKVPNAKAITYMRQAAPNLEGLSPQQVANLDLEQGVCFVQTDDDCTDQLLKVPQLLEVRPRCTLHGGATIRNVAVEEAATDSAEEPVPDEATEHDADDDAADETKTLAELYRQFGINWSRLLKLLDLPDNVGITKQMTLGEARLLARKRASGAK